MPATERYQVDWFAIIVLISSILILVFLVITAIYFFNLMNLKPPSRGESTFLFWTTIVLGIIFLAIAIFSLIKIFTYKSIVYEEPKIEVKTEPSREVKTTITTEQPITTPIKISNVPPTTIQTSNVTQRNLSDIPISTKESSSLNQELITLSNAFGL